MEAGQRPEEPRSSAAPALEARSLTKRYGAVLACDSVDLSVRRGEIHAILGQNGAGKTTLMNMFLGLARPDSGEIFLHGRAVSIADPARAASLGLAMVHQHFSLVGPLPVWENLTLGEAGRIDKRRTVTRIREVASRYTLDVDPLAVVDDLTTGQRQRVEIVKCLMKDPEVFILDEPTSVLTARESIELFRVLRQVVRQEERAVILISHKLDEVLHATDRVSIMRQGRLVAERPTSGMSAQELARQMIGHDVSLRQVATAVGHLQVQPTEDSDATGPGASAPGGTTEQTTAGPPERSEIALSIRDATARGLDGRLLLDGLSLEVRRGEILGLAGVEGNGQKALGDLLSSVLTLDSGSVEVGGKSVDLKQPGSMGRSGVGVIPEDRRQSGCVLDMSVAENLMLCDFASVSSRGFVNHRRMLKEAARLVTDFDIVAPLLDAPLRSLSGGNQQRVVLARELSRSPDVLVAAQPTFGLDVAAVEYMGKRLREAARSGVAVLLISTELEEILDLADRIAVIHRGKIVGEMSRREADLERIGMMMGGQAA
ncbi:MAG TPA: ABC transporter ATP-binding protein [Acidimicrobiales bacterium]|nr:ABC transporter ATP-binding protein [Acidimicrobiales bacterium]